MQRQRKLRHFNRLEGTHGLQGSMTRGMGAFEWRDPHPLERRSYYAGRLRPDTCTDELD